MVILAFLFIFFVVLYFIIVNVIFIVIWKARKRKGKTPKKRYIVIPIIFIVISLVIEVPPVGYVVLMRSANIAASKNIMADSHKIVYWSSITKNEFTLNGTDYIELGFGGSTDTWKLEKPIANIRSKKNEEGLNKFMRFLFAYDDTSTLYPIINTKEFDLYTIGSNIYCPKNEKDLIISYYKDFSNYDTQNCMCKYGVFSGNKSDSINYINKNITLNQNVFEKIYQMNDTQTIETVEIPEKDTNKEKPGTSIYDYDYRIIYVYTKDKVISKEIKIGLINEQLYRVAESGGGYIKGYRLSSNINEYLKNTIFLDN